MQCFGRNRDRTRCKNQTKFLFCKKHKHQLLIFLIITLPTIFLTYYGLYSLFFQDKETFIVRSSTSMVFKFPGPLVYVYFNGRDALNIAPIGIALVTEIVNNKPESKKIVDYELRMKTKNNWEKLPTLYIKDPTMIFWVNNSDLRDCTKLDFRNNSFDAIILGKFLKPWEPIKSWMFFEWPKDLRNKNNLDKLLLILITSDGNSEEYELDKNEIKPPIPRTDSGGEWHFYRPIEKMNLSNLKVLPYCDNMNP